MLWFIPTTHRVVIAGLLVVAAVAFVLFWVTRLAARRQGRRTGLPDTPQAPFAGDSGIPPHETPQAPFRGDPGIPPHETPQAPFRGDPRMAPPAVPPDE